MSLGLGVGPGGRQAAWRECGVLWGECITYFQIKGDHQAQRAWEVVRTAVWQASLPWHGFCNPALIDPDFLLPPGGQPQGGENGRRRLLNWTLPAGRVLLKRGTPTFIFFNHSEDSNHLNQTVR